MKEAFRLYSLMFTDIAHIEERTADFYSYGDESPENRQNCLRVSTILLVVSLVIAGLSIRTLLLVSGVLS